MTFSSKEICDIITSCKESSISKLSCGDFVIEFYDRNVESNKQIDFIPVEGSQADDKSEIEESDVDLDELAITNPVLWEKLLLNPQTE